MDTPTEYDGKGELNIRFASDGGKTESDYCDASTVEDDDDDGDENVSGNRPQSSGNQNENSEMRLYGVDYPGNRRSSSPYGLGLRRSSMMRRGKVAYEPTYRMEPKPGQYFIWFKARNMIANLADNLFHDFHYDGKTGATMCKLLCQKILLQAKKKFDYPRYRYVVHVTLAQLNNQGIMIADRSLWMAGIDNYAPFIYRTKEYVCVITFHAIFLE